VNRRVADRLVLVGLAVVLVVGLYLAWRSNRPATTSGMMSGMMGGTMGTGVGPFWAILGTVVVVVVLGGTYVTVRETLSDPSEGPEAAPAPTPTEPAPGATVPTSTEPAPPTASDAAEGSPTNEEVGASVTARNRRLLDLLPGDERRVLEPVLTSPGLTQIELRDRADFSKSKVSQTVSDLEKRGLLYRERQGRTYRVYPAEPVLEE